ncbi:hypothetical protein WJX72_011485 [[Myrmecia] bisecta]|uniref:50S ribosomal protein L22, chloroplastic n=1 Tax=[Myrmecia] bisecta TaxID=41462 RepID=A0AAW1PM92_9CHLO
MRRQLAQLLQQLCHLPARSGGTSQVETPLRSLWQTKSTSAGWPHVRQPAVNLQGCTWQHGQSMQGFSSARQLLAAISPKKLNYAATLLRKLHIDDALLQCLASPKKSLRMCHKVLLSAKANAVNNHGLDASRLGIEKAFVGRGTHLKRIAIHGRGRSGLRMKYRSHLTIVLKEGLVKRFKKDAQGRRREQEVKPVMKIVRPLLERPRRSYGRDVQSAAA